MLIKPFRPTYPPESLSPTTPPPTAPAISFEHSRASSATPGCCVQSVLMTAPVFANHQLENQFTAVYLLHQLLGEEQLRWLQQFSHLYLSDDEAKALVLAAETGAVDNAALRAISDLDTLAASQTLGRLHHQRHLLVKGGAGPATYYQLAHLPVLPLFPAEGLIGSDLKANASDLDANASDLCVAARALPPSRTQPLGGLLTPAGASDAGLATDQGAARCHGRVVPERRERIALAMRHAFHLPTAIRSRAPSAYPALSSARKSKTLMQ